MKEVAQGALRGVEKAYLMVIEQRLIGLVSHRDVDEEW